VAEVQLPLLPLLLDNVPPGLRLALAQEGIPCRDRADGKPQGRFVLFDSRRGPCRGIAPDQIPLDVDRLRAGRAEDPLAALAHGGACGQEWEFGGLRFSEVIAAVDKRVLRAEILEQLRAAIEHRGGVWLRVGPFPFPYRSAFSFRIDYDQHQPRNFDLTLAALAGHEDCTSHFVNASAYRDHPAALARLRGLDVGSHAYWHHTYRSAAENLANLRRGIETLRAARIEPSGFVAPHGRFNAGLLTAMERLEITHSSEFALAYDEFPFFPGGSRVLQIPVHPVCFEIMQEAVDAAAHDGQRGAGPQADRLASLAVEYFDAVARAKYGSGDPLFFYGHPTGPRGPGTQIVRSLLAIADTCGAVWKTTLSRFADWWRLRSSVRLSVFRAGEELVVQADSPAGDRRLAVEYTEGRQVALLPLEGPRLRFSPAALAYETRGGPPGMRPVRIQRREAFPARVKRWIDWERVTPVEEIVPNHWRNVAKRALRTLS
jgi:hypothetical protein